MSFDSPTIPGNITWDPGFGTTRISTTENLKPGSKLEASRETGWIRRKGTGHCTSSARTFKHTHPRHRGCPSQHKPSGVGKSVLTARAGAGRYPDILQRGFIPQCQPLSPSINPICRLFIAIHASCTCILQPLPHTLISLLSSQSRCSFIKDLTSNETCSVRHLPIGYNTQTEVVGLSVGTTRKEET